MHLLDINGTSKSITQKEFYCTKQWRTKQQIHDIVVYTTLTKHHTIIHLRTQPKTYSYRTHLIRYPRTHRWDTSHLTTELNSVLHFLLHCYKEAECLFIWIQHWWAHKTTNIFWYPITYSRLIYAKSVNMS